VSQRSIDTVPVNLHFGYILFKGKPWIFPEGAFEIAIEPFFSPVTAESSVPGRSASIEAGLMLPVLTHHFDLGYRVSPYIEGGLGILYHDFQGYKLGDGFIFTEMAGAGLSYFLDNNLSINVGYRFRHSSNASLYDDNTGLNSHSFRAGFSYFLPQN
jgi:opacity protein-like surface antigen